MSTERSTEVQLLEEIRRLTEERQALNAEIATLRNQIAALEQEIQQGIAARESEEHKRELSDALREVAKIVGSTLDLKQVLNLILAQLKTAINCCHASIILLEGEQLVLAAEERGDRQTSKKYSIPAALFPLNRTVLETRQPLLIPNVDDDPRWKKTDRTAGIRSFINAPLLVQDRPIGLLGVGRSNSVPFTPEDAQTVFAFAAQVAIAIENARLAEATRRALQETEGLFTTAQAILGSSNLQEVCRNLTVEFNKLVRAHNLSVYLFDPQKRQVVLRMYDGQPLGDEDQITYETLASGPGGVAIETRQPVLCAGPEVTEDSIPAEQGSQASRAGSLIAVPLIARGEVIGLVTATNREDERRFGQHDVDLLLALTAQAATAIDNIYLRDIAEQARKAAEEAAEAKGVFLAKMSHEIRLPLNAIIGMSYLLGDRLQDPQQRQFAQTIHSSGEALLSLLNDLLDFSKIEAGRMELERAPFSLRECVESALDVVTTKAAEKELEVAYLLSPGVPETIIGDSARLRQILTNLLSNAVKFTDHGQVVLTVSNGEPTQSTDEVTGPASAETCTLKFSVQDTGLGIPPEKIPNLFRSFSQVQTPGSSKYGGTGLGLTISRQLCRLMDGDMWVESQGIPGQGTTVHFTIRAEAIRQQIYTDSSELLAEKRILLLIANPNTRKSLVQHAERLGLSPSATDNAFEALEWIRSQPAYDLLVVDAQITQMEPRSLVEEIRQFEGGADLPVILLTHLGKPEVDPERALFSANLYKPVRMRAFAETVQWALSGQGGAPSRDDSAGPADSGIAGQIPLTILLVEDNAVNQQVALLMLEKLGYQADCVPNGKEALDALCVRSYDLVLMDCYMPLMDGEEATRQIRARLPLNKQPYIVALTASAHEKGLEYFLSQGMDDHLVKPLRIQDLIAALLRCQQLKDIPPARRQLSEPQPAPCSNMVEADVVEKWMGALKEPAAFSRVVGIYLEDAPRLLLELRGAIERADWENVRFSAHTLKSSSASMGAVALSGLMRQLEDLSARLVNNGLDPKGKEQALDLIAQAEGMFSRVAVELQSLREAPPSP